MLGSLVSTSHAGCAAVRAPALPGMRQKDLERALLVLLLVDGWREQSGSDSESCSSGFEYLCSQL
jgi:hypothetical protein